MKRARDEKASREEEEKKKVRKEKEREVEEEQMHVKVVHTPVEKQVQCEEAKVIEKIHRVETTRVQPIVHRDRYQVEVHQIVQPVVQKVTKATILEIKPPLHEELGTRVVEASAGTCSSSTFLPGPAPVVQSRSEVVSEVQHVEALPPIIEETVHRKIVERITPLILKEVVLPNMALVESFPDISNAQVTTAADGTALVTQTGVPVVIERLVIQSDTAALEARVRELEEQAQRAAEARVVKAQRKAEKRAAKLERKARKLADKAQRRAALFLEQQQHQQQQQLQQAESAAVVVPAVVVMDVDAQVAEDVVQGAEVVTTVDEAVVQTTTTTETKTETKAEVDKTTLRNFSPMIVTSPHDTQPREATPEQVV